MEKSLHDVIRTFKTTIVCRLEIQSDILFSPFEYLVGHFAMIDLPNFPDFTSLLGDVDPHGEVTEGIGYIAYCEDIKEKVANVAETGEPYSLLLPLRHPSGTKNFLCSLVKDENYLNVMFVYFDGKTGMLDFDSYVADSFKDRLTGLFNYNTFLRHLECNVDDGFICFFDLNKFKDVNDNFGHQVGDEVLQLASNYMISTASSTVIFYRRSGDEFMIYFLKNDWDYAIAIINRIEDYLESLPSHALKQYPGITCGASFGLVEIKGKTIDPETSVKLADLAMYQAKKAKKRMHIINIEDAEAILKMGNLDERLKNIQGSLKR